MSRSNSSRLLALLGLSVLLAVVAGCQKTGNAAASGAAAKAPAADTAKAGDDKKDDADEKDAASGPGVTLAANDAAKLGVATTEIRTASWVPEASGYAFIVSHDGIAQAVAELATARAGLKQSRAALKRASMLASGAGALSIESRESAERQAGLDAAALALAERKLTTIVGAIPAGASGGAEATLAALASGRTKLVRVTFPLDSKLPGRVSSLRIARIGAPATEPGWRTPAPWPAPAEVTAPGRSFFALLAGADVSEGEHLQAYAPVGDAVQGLLIPAAAVLQSAGRYWCYVEGGAGRFARVEVDVSRPLGDGYFVTENVQPGENAVTAAASLLLARELNPSREAGD